jgi:uncharacterized protein with PQ loop repeat
METPQEIRTIEVDQKSLKNLNITRKWTMFIAIIGFMVLGIMIFFGIITGTFLSAFKSGEKVFGISDLYMVIIFSAIGIICLFPVLFLFRFSKHTAKAVQTTDKTELYKALRNLKFYFVYLGMLIMLALSFYIAVLILAGSSVPILKGLLQ